MLGNGLMERRMEREHIILSMAINMLDIGLQIKGMEMERASKRWSPESGGSESWQQPMIMAEIR